MESLFSKHAKKVILFRQKKVHKIAEVYLCVKTDASQYGVLFMFYIITQNRIFCTKVSLSTSHEMK